jgi:hypothetical protein
MEQAVLAKRESETTLVTVRPELNLEKWPIWVPAQSRSKPKLRILERKRILENGSFTISKVEINPSLKYGNLTTEDQKVWYGLLQLWEEEGKPQTLVFSLRELAKILKKTWSTKVRNALKESLLRLNINVFTWINSYYDSKTKQTLEVLDSFQIVWRLGIAQAKQHVNNEQCFCQFSDPLYENLLANYTKPVFFDTLIKFKSGVAQLIYKYLELVMYDKTYYERNSSNLFDDIGLDDDEYKFVSARKRILRTAVEELKTVPFPGGILEVRIEETLDKSDWKLVVKKACSEANKPKKVSKLKEMQEESLKLKFPIETTLLQKEIVGYFLERFGLRREATKAELEKAKEMVEKYNLNFEKAKQFIDYAKCAAIETNYKPKNFNGIVQYIGEALAQEQKQEIKIQLQEKTKSCNFCNEEGLLGVIEQTGRRATMRCPHDEETLKQKAVRWNIKFEFWSDNPPNFTY